MGKLIDDARVVIYDRNRFIIQAIAVANLIYDLNFSARLRGGLDRSPSPTGAPRREDTSDVERDRGRKR
jgi:hypothetical protein